MTKSTVLIVGQRPDPHIDAVEKALQTLGKRPIILDRASGDVCAFRLDSCGSYAWIGASGSTVALADLTAVWWRVKPISPVETSRGTGTIAESMRWAEWRTCLRSLPAFTPSARWINPLPNHFHAGQKPTQLALAVACGFSIPKSIITNSAEDALKWLNGDTLLIYKTLTSPVLFPDEVIFTTPITRDMIRSGASSIALAPCIFQEYVEKAYELRITVVGDEVFPARIDSQVRPETSIDWRRNQLEDMYSVEELDATFLSRLRSFHARAGLVYGAYDFIIRPDGTPVFVECNPGGQWLWLENSLGLKISQALAILLCGDRRAADKAN